MKSPCSPVQVLGGMRLPKAKSLIRAIQGVIVYASFLYCTPDIQAQTPRGQPGTSLLDPESYSSSIRFGQRVIDYPIALPVLHQKE